MRDGEKASDKGAGEEESVPTVSFPGSGNGAVGEVGSYKLLSVLGEGGCGMVYLAEQQRPVKRRVALKIIKPGMDTKQVIARFEAERQALALLDHPNIAHVYTAGTTEAGRPYFVMEYVKGVPITEHCDRQKLNVVERLELFLQVCDAISHAHQKGIIHRDIKPSNILVLFEGQKALPKIIDFGVAKAISQPLTDRTLFTEHGQLLGTPEYMSPEQAEMTVQDIDTRSDIYSLGVVLYELLTGTLPFDRKTLEKAGFGEIQRIIREQDPPRPSTRVSSLGEEATKIAQSRRTGIASLTKQLHKELEWIPLKAMRKDRTRRYRSASELADDVQNYLKGAPLIAGPESAAYRLKKFVWRNRVSVMAVAAIAVALVVGLMVSTMMYLRAEALREQAEQAHQKEVVARARAEEAENTAQEQRKLAQERAEAYRRAMYRNNLALAKEAINESNIGRAEKLLNSCEPEMCGWEWERLKYISDQSITTFRGHKDWIYSSAISPDGRRIASASDDKTVKVWDTATGTELMTLKGHKEWVRSVVFSPDGTHIASGGGDKTIKIWDSETGTEVMTLKHDNYVYSVAFSPDGKRIASGGGDKTIKVWDSATGIEIKTLTGHEADIYSVTFSPDGKQIASGSSDKTIKVWDVNSGNEVMTLKGHKEYVGSVFFSPDGTNIASGSGDKTIKIWDAATGVEKMSISGHTGEVISITFSPDGKRIVSGSGDTTIKVWDANTGVEKITLRGHTSSVNSIAFSPDGKRIFSASGDETIKVWNPAIDPEQLTLYGYKGFVSQAAFSPDGKRIAAIGSNKVIKVWDVVSGAEDKTLRGHESRIHSIAFNPNGKEIVSGSEDKTVRVWNIATGVIEMTLTGHKTAVSSVAFSPDGKRIASGSYDKKIKVWDAESGAEVMTLVGHSDSVYGPERSPVTSITFSPDGKRIISAGLDQTVRVWDALTGGELMTLRGHQLFVYWVSVSPDGKRIASAGSDQTVRVWDAETGAELMTLRGHESAVYSAAFSPDGKRIVSTDYRRGVKVWDANTGTELMNLYSKDTQFGRAIFSPDGKTVCGIGYGDIKLWESTEPADGYEPRQTANSAREIVDELYKKHEFYYDVIARIKSDSNLSEAVGKAAVQIANTRLWEDAEKLNAQSWEVVRTADGNTVTYEEALGKVETAKGLEPDNWTILNTLGVAQYRVGAYENALATLTGAEKIRADTHEEPHFATTAFTAMALRRLGHDKEAQAALIRLRGLYKKEWFTEEDKEAFQIVVEAEKLLAGEQEKPRSMWSFIKDQKLEEAAKLVEDIRISSQKDDELAEQIKGAIKLLGRLYYYRGWSRWSKSGDYSEVIADFENAVRIDPNYDEAFNDLGWLRSTCPVSELRDGNNGVEAARKACELTDWKKHDYLSTLAAAYSEAANFNDAIKWQKEAINLLPEDKRTDLLSNYEARLKLYQSGKPYCQGPRWSISTGELVAWWKLDEVKDGNVVDSSGNGLHGKIVGDAKIVADSERGNVLKIGGAGFVDCGNNPAFDITGSITVTAWIRTNLDTAYSAIITKGDSAWRLHMYSNSNMAKFEHSGLETGGDSFKRWAGLAGQADVNDGTWHHLAGVYDGKKLYLYVDGKLDASMAAWGNGDKNNYPVYIGENSEILGREWNGLIDDVRIYSYALSQEEVAAIYAGEGPKPTEE